jgi:energy-converting hydrogenase Eha subunit F
MNCKELAQVYDAIAAFLKESGILANSNMSRNRVPFLPVNRDSMCNNFPSAGCPEDNNGAYAQTLEYIKAQFPQYLIIWGGKTDEDLFLEVIAEKK